jgi:hypothetical protein
MVYLSFLDLNLFWVLTSRRLARCLILGSWYFGKRTSEVKQPGSKLLDHLEGIGVRIEPL